MNRHNEGSFKGLKYNPFSRSTTILIFLNIFRKYDIVPGLSQHIKTNIDFDNEKGPLKITFDRHCTIMNFIHCKFFAMARLESSLLKRWCYGFTKTSMKCMLLRAAIIYIMEPQPVCTVGLTNKYYYFFISSCKILCKNRFNFFYINLQK